MRSFSQLALDQGLAFLLSADPQKKERPIAIALCGSGGKDSSVAIHATSLHLREIGYTGKLIILHADLGDIEWNDSLPMCQRLADLVGLELVVVRREAGGMTDRWEQRWASNLERYNDLRCLYLVLPWSTAGMRFCTAEQKTGPCCMKLVEMFPGHLIYQVLGIRREESDGRANAPVLTYQRMLDRVHADTYGYNWNPLVEWTLQDILDYHHHHNLPRHEAYTVYDSSRVSCSFCILSSMDDLVRSASCSENQKVYRRIVWLEIMSAFSFQSNRWLGDMAPHLLDEHQQDMLAGAKARAKQRQELEKRLPNSLKFDNHYPVQMVSYDDACLLAEVRQGVGALYKNEFQYSTPESVMQRVEHLLAEKAAKDVEKHRQEEARQRKLIAVQMQPSLWTPK